MIEKIGHYSLESPASIYDEEAMTALQLAGRTAAKVNECVEEVNRIPEQVEDTVDNHIKNGDFDKQIDKNMGNLGQRVDTLLASIPEGPTTMDAELIDLRTGYNKQVYDNAGNSVRKQLIDIGSHVGRHTKTQTITVDKWLTGKYYSTTLGSIIIGEEWKCSAMLYPCNEGVVFTSPDAGDWGNIMIICYDKELNLLGRVYVTKSGVAHNPPCGCTYAGTAFIGVNVKSGFTGDTLTLIPLSNEGMMYINHEDIGSLPDKALALYNYATQSGGSLVAGASFDCVYVLAKGIKKLFIQGTIKYNAVCFGLNNQVLQDGSVDSNYESVKTYTPSGEIETGRLYNVPDGTVYMAINFSNGHYWGGDKNNKTAYAAFVRDDMEPAKYPLMGKRVLAIGDSITYMDGMSNAEYNNTFGFRGWQSELRKSGAIVTTWGFNGRPYATSEAGGTGIAEYIIGGELDFTPFDAVVMFGGTNDVLYSSPIGALSGDHSTIYRGYDRFENSISYICHRILSTNKKCEIYLCSTIPSKSTERPFNKVMGYYDMLAQLSKYWCAPFIDLYRAGICMPGLNTDEKFYDTTHPKVPTSCHIGRVISKHLETYTK